MNSLMKHIHNIIYEQTDGSLLSFALFLISLLYGAAVRLRLFVYRIGLLKIKTLPCVVISIGNLTAGGAGKTPMTIFLARLIHEKMGRSAAVVSRGYKGGAEKTGGAVSDGKTMLMSSKDAGDEPFMMANRLPGVPVMAGRDRFASGMAAMKKFGAQVLVLDDGFQHIRLDRDINILLIDGRRFFGNRHLLPRGPLREPTSSVGRADAVVFTKTGAQKDPAALRAALGLEHFPEVPVFACAHVPRIIRKGGGKRAGTTPDFLNGKRALAFSGIAANDDFRQTLLSLGVQIEDFFGFADHHDYTDRELSDLLALAEEKKVDFICATEKDYARISTRISWTHRLVPVGVDISFGDDAEKFARFIKTRLTIIDRRKSLNPKTIEFKTG